MCCGSWVLVAGSMWLQCIAIWENPDLSWESNIQPAAPVAKGKGFLDGGHAGGIHLCCSLKFQFLQVFCFVSFQFPPTLSLTVKEKTQDNLLGKSYLEVASESLNTWWAENHGGKIQVYYCIHYFTSVKVASSSLSEGRNWPALGSLSHIAFASRRRPMWNILLLSVFLLSVGGLLRAAAQLLRWEEGLGKDGCVAGSRVLEPQEGRSGKMQL